MRRQGKQRLHLEKTTLRVLTDVELSQAHSAMRTALCTTQTESMVGCILPEPIDPGAIGEPDPIYPIPGPSPTVGQ